MSEWKTLSLGDLADIRVSNVDKVARPGEQAVKLCNYMDVYANDYITASLEFMESTASLVEQATFPVNLSDVLITKDSETPYDIGIPSVVIDEVERLVCGYHLAQTKPNRNIIDPIFLAKQLGSPEVASYFSRIAAGSTRYGLSNGAIARTRVAFPNRATQAKIARILFTLDQAIEKAEALIEKYQQIKARLMHDLFTRGIGPDGKLRPPREQAPELYQETPIGWIPKEWHCSPLVSKAKLGIPHIRTGPFGSVLKGEHWVEEGVPVITIGALGEGRFEESELLFISAPYAHRLPEFRMKVGDIVFSRVADVGRSATIEDDQDGWVMSSNLMRISVDRALAVPDFLQFQLAYDWRVKKQIRCRVNSGGRDVANGEVLNSLLFVWPTPKEQNGIVRRADAISARIEGEKDEVCKLRQRKAGLMHDLLTGKVPVSLDPAGPAHV